MTNEGERKIVSTHALSHSSGPPKGLATLAGALADDWPQLRHDMDEVLRTRSSARDRRIPGLPI